MTEGKEAGQNETGHLSRFRNWHGFLFAAVIVNLLFVYGMLGHSGDPVLARWYKALIWLPFNAIATLLYYVFTVKLAGATGGVFYRILCLVMVAANWTAMYFA